MTDVHFVVPEGVDDPTRPSGGNTYDRRVAAGLPPLGWVVHQHALPGAWPEPGEEALGTLGRLLAGLPDRATVLVDGLIASCAADVVVPEAARLRLVVLVHLPLGLDSGPAAAGESRVLSAAAGIVATSGWTRGRLVELYPLEQSRLHVAEPGVDAAALAPGTAEGRELLCVAAVTPGKGHDRLVAALSLVADLDWRCVCAGRLDLDPPHVEEVMRRARAAGIDHRMDFAGPLGPEDLSRAYAAADLLVHASRAETYGMVVTEALARGVPVVAMAVGGLPEALGRRQDPAALAEAGDPTGAAPHMVTGVPGILVPAGGTADLASAIRLWLSDAGVRQRLRGLAAQHREVLGPWSRTAQRVSDALHEATRS